MSFSEIILLMAIALILFGPEDLPEIARAIGKIVYEIRKATSELTDGFKDIVDSPMDSVKKAFEETTQRKPEQVAEENQINPKSESLPDLITYDGDPAAEVKASGIADMGNTDDPLAKLPPGMVSYEEKGASR